MAADETLLTADEACRLIRRVSAAMCREHCGMGDYSEWYFGGSSHNDDRLTAEVDEDGEIVVSDGATWTYYDGSKTESAIRAFVADWLGMVWGN